MSSDRPSLLAYLSEGFLLPLVGLAVLAGGLVGVVQHLRAPGPPPPPPERVADGGATGATSSASADSPGAGRENAPRPEGGLADGTRPQHKPARPAEADPGDAEELPRSRAGVRALLERGAFDRARRAARALGARDLEDEALLFASLTAHLSPGPLAGADLLRLETPDGPLLGRPGPEDPDAWVLETLDGDTRRVPRSEVRGSELLHGEAARSALDAELRRRREALGDAPSGLALHRLAYLAFACGRRALGAAFLADALRSEEGAILVDMFGEGDLPRLHAARRALAGLPAEEPLAQRSDPPTDPTPPREPP
ncbi:MAG: hypothetical protein D6731_07290, partial [Planctomycetota bacterium]